MPLPTLMRNKYEQRNAEGDRSMSERVRVTDEATISLAQVEISAAGDFEPHGRNSLMRVKGRAEVKGQVALPSVQVSRPSDVDHRGNGPSPMHEIKNTRHPRLASLLDELARLSGHTIGGSDILNVLGVVILGLTLGVMLQQLYSTWAHGALPWQRQQSQDDGPVTIYKRAVVDRRAQTMTVPHRERADSSRNGGASSSAFHARPVAGGFGPTLSR
jgi:hypothetical protein